MEGTRPSSKRARLARVWHRVYHSLMPVILWGRHFQMQTKREQIGGKISVRLAATQAVLFFLGPCCALDFLIAQNNYNNNPVIPAKTYPIGLSWPDQRFLAGGYFALRRHPAKSGDHLESYDLG